MSSSCSTVAPKAATDAVPFQYPRVEGGIPAAGPSADRSEVADFTSAELQSRIDAARLKGGQEGEARARVAFQAALQTQAQLLSGAVANFAAERASYFEKVEIEVVRLALAIAAKILHRESALDPMLLAGVVRVVLDTMDRATQIKLCVPPGQAQGWREWVQQTASDHQFQIVEDQKLSSGQCILETSLGTTELSIEAQLKEIERGFFDLLAHRPSCTP